MDFITAKDWSTIHEKIDGPENMSMYPKNNV